MAGASVWLYQLYHSLIEHAEHPHTREVLLASALKEAQETKHPGYYASFQSRAQSAKAKNGPGRHFEKVLAQTLPLE